MSSYYDTDPDDPDAPRVLNDYRGLKAGDSVRYSNPAWGDKTGGMDGPLVIDELLSFGGHVLAVLNGGEWEVNADNLALV